MKNIFSFVFFSVLVYYGFHQELTSPPDFNEIMRFVDNLVLGPFRAISEIKNGIVPAIEALLDWVDTIFPGIEESFFDRILEILDNFF